MRAQVLMPMTDHRARCTVQAQIFDLLQELRDTREPDRTDHARHGRSPKCRRVV